MKYFDCARRRSTEAETVLTLVDFSPSMEATDYEPTRLKGAIEANCRLVEIKADTFPDDRVGIIGFASDAVCLHSPQRAGLGKDALCRALRCSRDIAGGTDFTTALEMASDCLFGRTTVPIRRNWLDRVLRSAFVDEPTINPLPDSDTSQKRIILLSDGEHNGKDDPVSVADRLKQAGVIIECIGIAGSPDDVDEKRLRRIASKDKSGKPRYFFIGDTASLIRKYESMANQIRAL